MKKVFFFAVAIASISGFSSCKKDYTCTCTYASTTIPYEFQNVKKSEAEDVCTSWDSYYKAIDANASCTLE